MNWPFWLELLARSAGLLLVGEALRRLSGAQNAAFRHRLLLWVLFLVAFLPVLSVVLPEIRFSPWTPIQHQTATVAVRELSSRSMQGSPEQQPIHWLLVIWLAGVIVFSVPVLVGAAAAWRVARRAAPFQAGMASPGAEILISRELLTPLTCGLWHPRILLPATAAEWTPERLQAVLLHELAHVRRRDVTAQVMAHLVAALWWFQPLVWVLRRRLRSESELACDAEVLQSGLRPSVYASELLVLAKNIGPNYRLSSFSISMAHRSDLELRVRAILSPVSISFSRARTCGLSAALAAAAVAASALTVRSDQSFSEQGGSIMKRTLVSGLLTSVGLSAATISGSVHDSGGAAVASATVDVLNPDTGAKQETTTDSEGKFSLNGAGPGQYILQIEKTGLVSIFREFDLKAESNMERQFTMANEGGQPVVDQITSSDESPTKPVRVGGKVAQSNLIRKVQPTYPSAAKADHTQGTVEIEATISKDGVPTELRVVSSPSDDLSESSLEAVRQWRYRPTLLNGEPVGIVTTIIVNYTLSQ